MSKKRLIQYIFNNGENLPYSDGYIFIHQLIKADVRIDDIEFDGMDPISFKGEWFNGEWNDGTFIGVWHNGVFNEGIFTGEWYDGLWKDGLWKNGTWHNGKWKEGVWKKGKWKNGYIWDDNKNKYRKSKKAPNKCKWYNDWRM